MTNPKRLPLTKDQAQKLKITNPKRLPLTKDQVQKLKMTNPKRLPLTKDQVQKLKKEFMTLDADGDSTITVAELENVLRSTRGKLKASEADIKKAIKQIEKDGNGTIDLEQYLKICKGKTNQDLIHRALVQRSRVRKEFERFDKDGSGFITKEELMAVIQARAAVTISAEQIDKMMLDSDGNNEGLINYEEFVLIMTR